MGTTSAGAVEERRVYLKWQVALNTRNTVLWRQFSIRCDFSTFYLRVCDVQGNKRCGSPTTRPLSTHLSISVHVKLLLYSTVYTSFHILEKVLFKYPIFHFHFSLIQSLSPNTKVPAVIVYFHSALAAKNNKQYV